MRILFLATLLAAPALAQTPAPPARAPALALALEAAETAVKTCAGKKVAVTVLDAAGGTKLDYVPDGTAGWVGDFAKGKANTVVRYKKPSAEAGALAKTDPAIAAVFAQDKSLLPFGGGLPIMVGSEFIGAIAVAGAGPPEQDVACAKAGLEKIAARLK